MALTFPDGERFTTGVIPYQYRPATAYETTPRLILEVEIDGIQTEAVVDTGGIYLVCNPRIARLLHLETAEAISGVQSILLRGVLVQGRLYRLTLTILAEEGEDTTIETTAFVPEPEEAEHWSELPCFLGLYGCLECARFAVDPRTERFYFGPAAEAS
jgi:hypothetical protein